MFETKQSIRTVSDLWEALRRGDKSLILPTLDDLDDWETIFKHIGRSAGDPVTPQTLRRLEIDVSDQLELKIHSLGFKTLSEFAGLCDEALGHPVAHAKLSRRRPGRPVINDPADDAELTKAWKSSRYRTYEEGVLRLQHTFSGLTEKKLRTAVDRDRHRKRISK